MASNEQNPEEMFGADAASRNGSSLSRLLSVVTLETDLPRCRVPYPVVDVFAGPGGLGEGFASLVSDRDEPVFGDAVAIERDEFSHRTLFLRHFLRAFPKREFADDYYRYLKGDIAIEDLYRAHKGEFAEAVRSALRISLEPASHTAVQPTISARLIDRKRWVLVGWPPCQAYSLVGWPLLHSLRSDAVSQPYGKGRPVFNRFRTTTVSKDREPRSIIRLVMLCVRILRVRSRKLSPMFLIR